MTKEEAVKVIADKVEEINKLLSEIQVLSEDHDIYFNFSGKLDSDGYEQFDESWAASDMDC